VSGGLINIRLVVVAGACLAALLGSFVLSRPRSEADSGEEAPLPPARVVGTVEPAPLPELGDASKLPALGRKERPRPARRRPAPAPPEEPPEEPVEPEPESVAPAPVEPAPVQPAPVEPSPPTYQPPPAPPEPEPEPPPVYFDDSG
jgi:hypothetical protein